MAPVVSIQAEVYIQASAKHVWEVLSDTSTWPDWNSFVPLAEGMGTVTNDLSSHHVLSLGARCRFHAMINGSKQPTVQKVTELELPIDDPTVPQCYRICWTAEGFPTILFRTLRFNEIEEVDSGDKPACVYRTREDQWGPVARVVKIMVGKQVEKGINDWAQDLKRYVEKTSGKVQGASTETERVVAQIRAC